MRQESNILPAFPIALLPKAALAPPFLLGWLRHWLYGTVADERDKRIDVT